MRFTLVAFCALFVAAANAHFLLNFPGPRGAFNEDEEPNFCGGHADPTTNRTLFPVQGGYFSLFSAHTQWTVGVYLATGAASGFGDFKQVKPFFQQTGEGDFCFPLNFTASANATGLTNGQNVSIEILFDGGDGSLYQCADLTLSNTVQLSTTTNPCVNGTNSTSSGTSTSSGAAPSNSNSASERTPGSGLVTVVLGLAGLAGVLSF